jgi:ABC-type multidrug transport system fused ATPase/permease subunit
MMSWNEIPAAYRFCILLVVMAVATVMGTGDWIIAVVLLAIASLAFLVSSIIPKLGTQSSHAESRSDAHDSISNRSETVFTQIRQYPLTFLKL